MCDSSTEGAPEEQDVCAYCGEQMNEYDDCLESEDGKHESQQARSKLLEALRSGSQAALDDLMAKVDAKLRGNDAV
jgi:hypothetical protein